MLKLFDSIGLARPNRRRLLSGNNRACGLVTDCSTQRLPSTICLQVLELRSSFCHQKIDTQSLGSVAQSVLFNYKNKGRFYFVFTVFCLQGGILFPGAFFM